MIDARLRSMAQKMAEVLLDYGPGYSQFLLRVMRRLANGLPVTKAEVDGYIAELGLAQDEAEQFLQKITERNADGQVVGIMGLSLNDSPHRLYVNDVGLSAWCAEDTLFLPAMLQQTATIESPSPVSGERIRLTVSPERVESVNPTDAVLSIVVIDPTEENTASVQAIWRTFCNHIHFFVSREEAEKWATGRTDIAIITVEEGLEFGQQVWSNVLPYAEQENRKVV